jgi:MoaE-MoaD fusion protein
VKVRLFASLREIAGSSWVDAGASGPVDAGSLVDVLAAEYGDEFGRIARAGTVVVNGEPAGWDRALDPQDEVALLPPVSGGGPPGPRRFRGR